MELELTGDGNWVLSANSILKSKQAFLAGDLEPLLELLAESSRGPFRVTLSPHFSKLLIDILTGKIKRPNRRPKKIQLSRNDIVSIGLRVEDRRKYAGESLVGAIETVAEGAPAIEGLEGPEWLEIPKIPKTRVKQAHAAFQQLKRKEQPSKSGRSRTKSSSSKK